MKRWSGVSFLAMGILVQAPWGGSLAGADFIRGDVNMDGVVNAADLEALAEALYLDSNNIPQVQGLPCVNAGDVNDDGTIWTDDLQMLMDHIHLGTWPPAPYPAIGPDPTPNEPRWWDGPLPPLDCQSYGGGGPLVDPMARLKVKDLIFGGGAEGKAVLEISLSNSRAVVGFVCEFKIGGDILMGVQDYTPKADHPNQPWANGYLLENGDVRVEGILRMWGKIGSSPINLATPVPYPPGEDSTVALVTVCLREGAVPGDYPITMLSAELVDSLSERSVYPAIEDSTLTVLDTVTADLRQCEYFFTPPVNATFKIEETKGKPGSEITVPIQLRADMDIVGYTFSLDFDETVLEATSLEFAWQRPDGEPYFTHIAEVNNVDRVPGSGGVDEGFAVGAAIIADSPDVAIPADVDHVIALLHLKIKPDATASSTRLKFIDGGHGKTSEPIPNSIALYDQENYYIIHAAQVSSIILLEGKVTILPDIAVFSRGDANDDGKLDLSDAVASLAFLYQGGARPACLDAADFTDDGVIDISDPIASLNFLYLGGPAPAAPYPAAGEDPTEDLIGCFD